MLRELSKVSGGVDALLEKDPVQKEWQEVKNLVEVESVEAKALEHSASGHIAGSEEVVAESSASAGAWAGSSASAAGALAESDFLDKLAKEHVRAYVKLVQEPATLAGVEQAVQQSGLRDIHGQERRNVFMIMLSADSLSEVAGRGLHRRAPVEFSVLKKLVHGALLGRGGSRDSEENPVAVPPGDVVALHDGGRSGVQQMFTDLWRPTHKLLGHVVKHSALAVEVKQKKLTLVMNEETVRQMKSRVRGASPYTLVHCVTLASGAELVPDMCPEKPRSKYSGYNVGDALGFINLENHSKVWQAEFGKKRDIYGPRMIQLKDSAEDAADPAPKQEDMQPVFYHQLPSEYYLEIIHSYSVVGILDLACGGGPAAQACLTKRIPYVGFCLSEAHIIELEKFLVSWVKDMMCTEGHLLWRKGAVKEVKEVKEEKEQKEKDKYDKNEEDGKKGKRKRAVSTSESSERRLSGLKRKQALKKKKAAKKKRSSDESSSCSI